VLTHPHPAEPRPLTRSPPLSCSSWVDSFSAHPQRQQCSNPRRSHGPHASSVALPGQQRCSSARDPCVQRWAWAWGVGARRAVTFSLVVEGVPRARALCTPSRPPPAVAAAAEGNWVATEGGDWARTVQGAGGVTGGRQERRASWGTAEMTPRRGRRALRRGLRRDPPRERRSVHRCAWRQHTI
jgi:hypothetical protein